MKSEEFANVDSLIQVKIVVLVKKDTLKTLRLVNVILLALVQNKEETLIAMAMGNVSRGLAAVC